MWREVGELGQHGHRLWEWDRFRDDERTSPMSATAVSVARAGWWSLAGVEALLLEPSSAEGEAGLRLLSISLSDSEIWVGDFPFTPLPSVPPPSCLATLARFSGDCLPSPGDVLLRL